MSHKETPSKGFFGTIKSNLSLKTIRGQLITGFTLAAFVIIVITSVTLWKINQIENNSAKLVAVRTPVSEELLTLNDKVVEIERTLSELSSNSENTIDKNFIANMWLKSIDKSVAKIEENKLNWEDGRSLELWTNIQSKLVDLKSKGTAFEELLYSENRYPADKIFHDKIEPSLDGLSRMFSTINENGIVYSEPYEGFNDLLSSIAASLNSYLLTGSNSDINALNTAISRFQFKAAEFVSNGGVYKYGETTAENFLKNKELILTTIPNVVEMRQTDSWDLALSTYKSDLKPLVAETYTLINKLNIAQQNLISEDTNYNTAQIQNLKMISILLLIIGIVICLYIGIQSVRRILNPLAVIKDHISRLSHGELPEEVAKSDDEIGEMIEATNQLTENLNNVKTFALEVGKGQFDTQVNVFNDQGELGGSLANMRESLKKVAEEDARRNWANEGLAKFSELLRQDNDNLEVFSRKIISNLVKYLNVNQGALYIVNNDDDGRGDTMKMEACYAYGRDKFVNKDVLPGEGLVGQAWLEKERIILTEVPKDYVTITSGLGEATPSCVLIVPLKLNDQIFGMLEMASFAILENFQIDFVEKVAESIASTISSVKINVRTAVLLKQAQVMTEQMKQQEEEMRQNMEEMQAQQDEMGRTENELKGQQGALNNAAIVSEVDLKGYILSVNDEFCRVAEYNREELIGKKQSIVRHPDMPAEAFVDLWSTITRGQVWKGRVKNKKKNGGFYWVEATITPVMGEDGKPIKYIGVRFDITEQVKQEEEIHQQMEEMRAQEEEMRQNMEEMQAIQEEMGRSEVELRGQQGALNNAAIVSEVDLQGYILFVNDEFCRMAEYNREELIGKKQSIVRHPDMPAEAFTDMWATITKGNVWRGRVKNKKKGGGFYWVNATITPVLGEDGKPVKYIGVRFDITEQVKQEEEIHQQLEEMRAQEEEMRQNMEEMQAIQEEMGRSEVELRGQQGALNNAAIVSEVDLQGYILFVNDEFCRMAEYNREELIGKKQSIVRHPDMPAEAFTDMWATITKGNVWKGRVKNKKKGGGFYWVEATITPVLGEDGKPVKYIGVRFDITEQVKQEEEIHQQLEEMRAQEEEMRQNMEEMQAIQEEMTRNELELKGQQGALNNAAIVSETDLKGVITYVNDEFCRIAKYTPDELLGQLHNIVRHPDMPAAAFENLWDTISKGNVWKGRVKNKKKDGDFYWVNAVITPVLGENGKPIKYIGVRFDITALVLQEEKIAADVLKMEELSKKNKANSLKFRDKMEELDLLVEGKNAEINVLKKEIERLKNQ